MKKISFIISFILLFLNVHSDNGQSIYSANNINPGEWQFKGHLGKTIDKIARNRILDKAQWDIIYPETKEAFLLKEDDDTYPKFGAWRGEFWGKYMLSVIAAANYYHSEELKNRIKNATYDFIGLMDDKGYLGTYKKSDFVMGNNWNVWGRKYTLWGLIEAWELLGEKDFLEAAGKVAENLFTEVGPGQTDIIKTGNFYGMPSTSILQPMVKLYNCTKNKKYLDYAEYIVKQWSLHPEGLPDILNKGLSGSPVHQWFPEKDPMNWAKGYEFTSCVEGLVELYKVTKNEKYLTAAKNIHAALVKYERSPVGSVSFNDKFIGSAGLINTVAEICDAVYWNRLSFELYQITGDIKYVDEMERTLYNSMLCAFNPQGTWGLRRLRTSHIHIPAQNHFLYHHQCCTDNLPRGLFQAAEFAVMVKKDTLFINLFNEGDGKVFINNQPIGISIKGDFLTDSQLDLEFTAEKEMNFVLAVRKPYWSSNTSIELKGPANKPGMVNGYIISDRKWSKSNSVKIRFKIDPRWENFEPEKFDDSFHEIAYYNKFWAQMKFLGGTNNIINERYKNVDTLSVFDALPQAKAVMFFYGPLALARDIRISKNNIFSKINVPENKISVRALPEKANFWKLFEIDFGDGKNEIFCDFSSAGNTWNKTAAFNTWCLVNLTQN